MAAAENIANVGSDGGRQSPMSPSSFPVCRRSMKEDKTDAVALDAGLRTSSASTMLSATPTLLSSKATAFSIDSLIKSRESLVDDFDGDNDVCRPYDGGDVRTRSCSSADLEYMDGEDVDDGQCSLDGADVASVVTQRRRSTPELKSPLQSQGKIYVSNL
jgi:hypothetical protein